MNINGLGNRIFSVRDEAKSQNKKEDGSIQKTQTIAHKQSNSENKRNIYFFKYIESFISLLSSGVYLTLRIPIRIAQLSIELISSFQIIVLRILFSAPFDPRKASFKKMIQEFENKVPEFKERIIFLDSNFSQKHRITDDLSNLQQLNFQLSKIYKDLNYYAEVLTEDREYELPKEVQKVLDHINKVKNLYEVLNNDLNDFCTSKGTNIINEFYRIVCYFSVGGLPKQEILSEILKDWKLLNEVILSRFNLSEITEKSKYHDLKDLIKYLESLQFDSRPENLSEPLKLSNIGNSCYISSVLQLFLCTKYIIQMINLPLEIPKQPLPPIDDKNIESVNQYKAEFQTYQRRVDEYTKKLALQKEILQFRNKKNRDIESYTPMTYFLYLKEGPSIHRLRDKIFESKFHADLKTDIRDQHDAAALMELLVPLFLPDCVVTLQEHVSALEFPGLNFIKKKGENHYCWQIPLYRSKGSKDLFEHIKHYFRSNRINDERTLDPKNTDYAVRYKSEQKDLSDAKQSLLKKEEKVGQYFQTYKIQKLPPILFLHFKRFHVDPITQDLVKDNDDIILPKDEDGIINLKPFCEIPNEKEFGQTRYKIKGFVVHDGTIHGGHYFSFVEINGKYYYCNDMKKECYKEITKSEFFNQKGAYLLVLERLPESEKSPTNYQTSKNQTFAGG